MTNGLTLTMAAALVTTMLLTACNTDKTDDDSGSITPDGGDDTSPVDDTGDSDDTAVTDDTGESGWMKSNCEYETPPTPFTGGLVYLAYEWPDGGNFSIPYEDNVMTDTTGTVDWDADTLESETHYVDGSTTVLSERSSSFVIDNMGDYTATATNTRTQLNGDSQTTELSITKTGCVTVSVSVHDDTSEVSTTTTTLVSNDTIETEMVVTNDEGDDVTYYSVGERSSDWSLTYTFQTDSTDTDVNPDREGTCTYSRDGTTVCDMTMYYDNGQRQDAHSVWKYDGDWEGDWFKYATVKDTEPTSWGIRSGDYWGAGEAQWWTVQSDSSVVECSGSWDSDNIGTWSCDNGSSGTYP